MTDPTPLNQAGRDLLVAVEDIADRVKRGEVIGMVAVCVQADTDCFEVVDGLFWCGYKTAGHCGNLIEVMNEIEKPTSPEEEG